MNKHYHIAPDTRTDLFMKNNNLFSYFSVIPRTNDNDIGLFHPLGCTTLYYNNEPTLQTIKFITSDDIKNEICNNDIEIIHDKNMLSKYWKYNNLIKFI